MDDLLVTRIIAPPLRPGLVARERLRTEVRAGFAHGLTLITAPAGAGKTTLLIQAVADAQAADPQLRVAWLALDSGDNDPVRFWRYLLAACERAAPGAWNRAEALLRAAAHHPGESTLTAWLNSAADLAHPLILALDDYHLITEPAIHAALALLIERAPPQLHVAMTTRSTPPLPLERLRVRRRLVEVRPADLGFTLTEAQALLGPLLGMHLDPAAVAALVARTDGWGAGLILAAHTARTQRDPTQVAATFSGASPPVLDYVVGEVLAEQPPELRAFVQHTAVLDRFSAALCAAVLDPAVAEPAAQALLEQVDRANLFLIALDDERRWFRYHHLFAEAVRTALARTNPALLRATRLRAAHWLAANAAAPDAIPYALAAEAWAVAADLIGAAGRATLLRGEVATLQNWLAALPANQTQAVPRLVLLEAWVRVLQSDLSGAARIAATIDAGDPLAHEAQLLLTTIAILRGQNTSLTLPSATPDAATDDPFLQAMAALNVGFLAQFAGDVARALPALHEAVRLGKAHQNDLIAFIGLCQLGEIELLRGRPHAAAEWYTQARAFTRNPDAPAALLDSSALEGLGAVAYELGDLEHAETLIRASIAGNSVLGDLAAVDAHLAMADIAALRNDRIRVDTHLAAADTVAQRLQLDVFTTLVAAHRARLDARLDNLEAAIHWMERVDAAGERGLPPLINEIEDLTRAYIFCAADKPAAALALADKVVAVAATADHGRRLVEAHLLRSRILHRLGRLEEAHAARAAAEQIARPTGLQAVFLEAAALPAPADAGAADPDQLTERELEVLRLIAAGLSNQAIAERLIVAPSTVKKHINRIFAKLDVVSRTQAVARARERRLLVA